MGLKTNFLLSLMFMFAVPLMANSIVWNVGGSLGWSPQNYTSWPKPFFLVGDGIRFVYNPNTTDVLEVSYCDFKSCNSTSPLATYNTGNDTIPLTKQGHQYFMSSNLVDCNNGMKLHIMVSNSTNATRVWIYNDDYVHVPEFEDIVIKAENITCDSTSSTEKGVVVEANSNSSTVAPTAPPPADNKVNSNSSTVAATAPAPADNKVNSNSSTVTTTAPPPADNKVNSNSSSGGEATSTPATPPTPTEAGGGKAKIRTIDVLCDLVLLVLILIVIVKILCRPKREPAKSIELFSTK